MYAMCCAGVFLNEETYSTVQKASMYRMFHSKKRRISLSNLLAAVHVVTVQEKEKDCSIPSASSSSEDLNIRFQGDIIMQW